MQWLKWVVQKQFNHFIADTCIKKSLDLAHYSSFKKAFNQMVKLIPG